MILCDVLYSADSARMNLVVVVVMVAVVVVIAPANNHPQAYQLNASHMKTVFG